MDKFEPLQRFTKKMPGGRMSPAMGPATLCAVFVETDRRTGLRSAPNRSASAAASSRLRRSSENTA